jgi:hypothetical protein
MRKLSKKSKAVLGTATFLLFAFAGAQAGALDFQVQRLDSSALRSHGLSAAAALHRLPATRSHLKVVQSRRAAGNVADTSLLSFSHGLPFAGGASSEVPPANDLLWRGAQQPRAPPLS